ncbi:MAG: HAD-IIIA family hydrolase [Burkholderiales bacterium]|nr:HAD-IIIA family hydrolase [Burkholderiales bacterium]
MKLIVLDRDGVINEDSDQYIKHPDEWHPLPGSLEAIARLHQAGWTIAIASNQSGLARGLFDITALTDIHQKFRKALATLGGNVDAIFVCPHRFDTALEGVPAIGDSLRDLQASATAGCVPWLVQTGNGLKTATKGGLPAGTRVAKDLANAVDQILSETH